MLTVTTRLQWGRGHRPRKAWCAARRAGYATTRFNGAAVIDRGKHFATYAPAVSSRRFNGAAVIDRGKPLRTRRRFRMSPASMGPRSSTAESLRRGAAHLDRFGASMGPRSSTAESLRLRLARLPQRSLQWGRGHRPRKAPG